MVHTIIGGIVACGLLVAVSGCGSESTSATRTSNPVESIPERRAGSQSTARARTFQFDVGATLHELPSGSNVRIWMPVPPTDRLQTVRQTEITFPAATQIGVEPKYGNRILFCETVAPKSGELPFRVSYEITRSEAKRLDSSAADPLAEARRRLFLLANAKVPVGGRPAALIESLELPQDDPLAVGRALYDYVGNHMQYDKSRPGYGRGDAAWACDSRFGNCTDFHSLFIAMARSQELPARFEIGYPLPRQRGKGEIHGYHCWAYFFADRHGWIPVDISEGDKHPELRDYYFGNLSENRVAMSVGRDLVLVPPQEGPALNFFVDPYVEVDGKPWPQTKMTKQVTFHEVEVRR